MTNDETMTKSECQGDTPTPDSVVGISDLRVSFVIRHSDFVIAPRLVCSLKFPLRPVTSLDVARFQDEKEEGYPAWCWYGFRWPQTSDDRSELRPGRRQQGNARRDDREGRQDTRKAQGNGQRIGR